MVKQWQLSCLSVASTSHAQWPRQRLGLVAVQLFVHMCEANVQPVLADVAGLVSNLAVDGKWVLSEKLFFYVFRRTPGLQPPPRLEQADLVGLSTSDLNAAYMLDSALRPVLASSGVASAVETPQGGGPPQQHPMGGAAPGEFMPCGTEQGGRDQFGGMRGSSSSGLPGRGASGGVPSAVASSAPLGPVFGRASSGVHSVPSGVHSGERVDSYSFPLRHQHDATGAQMQPGMLAQQAQQAQQQAQQQQQQAELPPHQQQLPHLQHLEHEQQQQQQVAQQQASQQQEQQQQQPGFQDPPLARAQSALQAQEVQRQQLPALQHMLPQASWASATSGDSPDETSAGMRKSSAALGGGGSSDVGDLASSLMGLAVTSEPPSSASGPPLSGVFDAQLQRGPPQFNGDFSRAAVSMVPPGAAPPAGGMPGELLCCNEMLAVYASLGMRERAVTLVQRMLECAADAGLPSSCVVGGMDCQDSQLCSASMSQADQLCLRLAAYRDSESTLLQVLAR